MPQRGYRCVTGDNLRWCGPFACGLPTEARRGGTLIRRRAAMRDGPPSRGCGRTLLLASLWGTTFAGADRSRVACQPKLAEEGRSSAGEPQCGTVPLREAADEHSSSPRYGGQPSLVRTVRVWLANRSSPRRDAHPQASRNAGRSPFARLRTNTPPRLAMGDNLRWCGPFACGLPTEARRGGTLIRRRAAMRDGPPSRGCGRTLLLASLWGTTFAGADRSRVACQPKLAEEGRSSAGERRLAEREGFEPPVGFPLRRFSRPEPSTTRPPLRGTDEEQNTEARRQKPEGRLWQGPAEP